MLIRCGRTKKIYLKLIFAFFVTIWVVLYVRTFTLKFLSRTEGKVARFAAKFENILQDYETKIITGLGNDGEPAFLEGEDQVKGDESVKKFALNTVVSDRIPLDRKLRDPRNPRCKEFTYNPKLKTSVIIIFYNELLSVVLRTIWSVILQTPSHLLQEIILVDDCSTIEPLKALLDYYLLTRLKDHNIRLVRLSNRMGLIRARLQGARVATGDVLVFLDSHCEVTIQWLEPLLARIEEDKTAVVVPIIDVIEATNFAYSTNGETEFQVGGFSWIGHFTWIDIQNEDDKTAMGPIKSPTMAGGLFAIDRNFFWDIGSYDEQMDGWGGENLEMSFRIWQCGGKLETVPCSRVGHVFREFHPYSFPDNKDTHAINTARLVEVWMDDYKRFFYMYEPSLENNPVIGDLTHRKQLRHKLRCKSFKWYLDNIYPEKFVLDERVFAYGQVTNGNGYCLDDLQLKPDVVGPLGLYGCHVSVGMTQYFSISLKGELRSENFCAEVHNGHSVQLAGCHGHKKNQYWMYYVNGTIYHPSTNKCLTSYGVEPGKALLVEKCKNIRYQIWKFSHLNETALMSNKSLSNEY